MQETCWNTWIRVSNGKDHMPVFERKRMPSGLAVASHKVSDWNKNHCYSTFSSHLYLPRHPWRTPADLFHRSISPGITLFLLHLSPYFQVTQKGGAGILMIDDPFVFISPWVVQASLFPICFEATSLGQIMSSVTKMQITRPQGERAFSYWG